MEWCPVCQANRNVVKFQFGPLAVFHTCEKCRTTLRMNDVGKIGGKVSKNSRKNKDKKEGS